MDFIDWSGVECLNQSTSHSVPNALKQVIIQSLRLFSSLLNIGILDLLSIIEIE